MTFYLVEMTDTFGGEANYSWVTRHTIEADSPKQAIRRFKFKEMVKHPQIVIYDDGDFMRVDLKGSNTCIIATYEGETEQ